MFNYDVDGNTIKNLKVFFIDFGLAKKIIIDDKHIS